MNPNQTSQNLKRKFSLIAQPNSIPYSDSNGDFDASWKEKFNGSAKQITLLSVTTAPSGTFTKGSQYYNSTDKLIYTAINDDTWTGATTSSPEFGIIYLYDNSGTNEYYIWDGDNLVETDLEKYQLKSNITNAFNSSSTVTYPSSKALKDGLDNINPEVITNADNTDLQIQANKIYKFTTTLTTLTITSVVVSDFESRIYFTTGGTIAFTDNSSLKWGGDGSAPFLEINTIYCIAICNGLAEIDTFGTVS